MERGNFSSVTEKGPMRNACKSCGSVNQNEFNAEMAIHFVGLENIDKPALFIFPKVAVCLDCGTAKFAVREAELRQLANGDAAAAG